MHASFSLFSSHYHHLQTKPESPWQHEEVDLTRGLDAAELVISGIYIRLFIANPGWVLRKPREFLTDLMENALQIMNSSTPDLQRMEAVTEALVKLLSAQPTLAELVPATGYLSRIFNVLNGLDARTVKGGLIMVNELAK
jgi:DnaJ family protein C protein 13